MDQDLDFAMALEAAAAGYAIRRRGWDIDVSVTKVRGFYVNTLRMSPARLRMALDSGPEPDTPVPVLRLFYPDHFAKVTGRGDASFWLPSQEDLLARDWVRCDPD